MERRNLSTGRKSPSFNLHLGDRCQFRSLNGHLRTGNVKFIGHVKHKKGLNIGIETDGPVGPGDGMEGGIRYFTAEPRHGVFVPAQRVTSIDDNVTERKFEPIHFGHPFSPTHGHSDRVRSLSPRIRNSTKSYRVKSEEDRDRDRSSHNDSRIHGQRSRQDSRRRQRSTRSRSRSNEIQKEHSYAVNDSGRHRRPTRSRSRSNEVQKEHSYARHNSSTRTRQRDNRKGTRKVLLDRPPMRDSYAGGVGEVDDRCRREGSHSRVLAPSESPRLSRKRPMRDSNYDTRQKRIRPAAGPSKHNPLASPFKTFRCNVCHKNIPSDRVIIKDFIRQCGEGRSFIWEKINSSDAEGVAEEFLGKQMVDELRKVDSKNYEILLDAMKYVKDVVRELTPQRLKCSSRSYMRQKFSRQNNIQAFLSATMNKIISLPSREFEKYGYLVPALWGNLSVFPRYKLSHPFVIIPFKVFLGSDERHCRRPSILDQNCGLMPNGRYNCCLLSSARYKALTFINRMFMDIMSFTLKFVFCFRNEFVMDFDSSQDISSRLDRFDNHSHGVVNDRNSSGEMNYEFDQEEHKSSPTVHERNGSIQVTCRFDDEKYDDIKVVDHITSRSESGNCIDDNAHNQSYHSPDRYETDSQLSNPRHPDNDGDVMHNEFQPKHEEPDESNYGYEDTQERYDEEDVTGSEDEEEEYTSERGDDDEEAEQQEEYHGVFSGPGYQNLARNYESDEDSYAGARSEPGSPDAPVEEKPKLFSVLDTTSPESVSETTSSSSIPEKFLIEFEDIPSEIKEEDPDSGDAVIENNVDQERLGDVTKNIEHEPRINNGSGSTNVLVVTTEEAEVAASDVVLPLDDEVTLKDVYDRMLECVKDSPEAVRALRQMFLLRMDLECQLRAERFVQTQLRAKLAVIEHIVKAAEPHESKNE